MSYTLNSGKIRIFGTIDSSSDAGYCPVEIRGARKNTGGNTGTSGIPVDRGVVRISNDGDNTVATFTGEGLCFHSDTAAANALDDYEEGSFTPTYNNGSVSYSYQHGFYTKVGCLVTVWFDFTVSACSGQSGVPSIGGLPFNKSFNGSSGHYEGVGWWNLSNNFTGSNSCAQGYISNNQSSMNMYRGNTPQQGSPFVANQTGRIAGTFSYSAAS